MLATWTLQYVDDLYVDCGKDSIFLRRLIAWATRKPSATTIEVFLGGQLEDDRTLSDFNVHSQITILGAAFDKR